jgi:hypothetical protein
VVDVPQRTELAGVSISTSATRPMSTEATPDTAATQPIERRLGALDWSAIEADLSARGYAETAPVLTPSECARIADSFDEVSRFRSTIDMAKHRFGIGVYRYFAYPLPEIISELREHAYAPLSRIANAWHERLGIPQRFPSTLADFLEQCAAAGQTRPTPLVLRYEAGGYNCLHQDLYGDLAFPMQMLCFLDRPGVDYEGGEFVMVEQRPRAQSAAEVIAGRQGALVFFTTRTRPVAGSRGYYRVNVRHGVSRVRAGVRRTLGVIFHDAR